MSDGGFECLDDVCLPNRLVYVYIANQTRKRQSERLLQALEVHYELIPSAFLHEEVKCIRITLALLQDSCDEISVFL